ncbi:hypothetical protein [Streptomyces sp. NPDC008001]|uniref:hypothetical protein n=1 Tax=Streptomyces sp. NPDC008001 TaxID=3364804 RepID=UPI0036EAFC25
MRLSRQVKATSPNTPDVRDIRDIRDVTPSVGSRRSRTAGAALSALALAVSGLALAPAVAAAPRGAAGTEYCAATQGFYGKGQYTYLDVTPCVDPASSRAYIKFERVTYYWGGAWYSASSSNEALIEMWSVNLTA